MGILYKNDGSQYYPDCIYGTKNDKYNIKNITKENIDRVNDYISKKDATAFIYFKVNDFELDTRSVDTEDHYAVSLENVKTGAGTGNQFTLRITYNNQFSGYKSALDLEKALSGLSNAILNSGDLFTTETISGITNSGRNRCYLKYGYLNSYEDLSTPEYTGLLLKYEVTANQQILQYTLTGISGEDAQIGTVNWYPAPDYSSEEGQQTSTNSDGKETIYYRIKQDLSSITDPTKKAEYMNKAIKELNNQLQTASVFNPFDALYCFLYDYNKDIEKIDNNATKFKIVLTEAAMKKIEEGLKPCTISLCRNQTPISYIEYLISMFAVNTNNYAVEKYRQDMGIVDRWIHEFRYNKEENETLVIISVISSEDSDDFAYEFNGYTPNNNLLIDYNLTYDGTVALSVVNTTVKDKNQNQNVYINKNGLLMAKASVTKDMFVYGELDEVLINKQNTIVDKIACANNCTMTTFGLPFEITVGTIFKVKLHLGYNENNSKSDTNILHHSSGRCYVTGITDKIENNSFKTYFNMIRLPGSGGVEA